MTRLNDALVAAAEYRALIAAGRYPEAEQVESTIDELIGRWAPHGFVWPPAVAEAAGVSARRRRAPPGRGCQGDRHEWPEDYSDGDTCACGALYLFVHGDGPGPHVIVRTP